MNVVVSCITKYLKVEVILGMLYVTLIDNIIVNRWARDSFVCFFMPYTTEVANGYVHVYERLIVLYTYE